MVPGCPPPILHLRKKGLGSQLHRSSLPEPRLEWPKPDAVQKSQLPSKEGYQGLGEQKKRVLQGFKSEGKTESGGRVPRQLSP